MEKPLILERVERGLWAFVAINGDVQVGWCRKFENGWWIEDMDGKRIGGPCKNRDHAEVLGVERLAHLSGESNPGW